MPTPLYPHSYPFTPYLLLPSTSRVWKLEEASPPSSPLPSSSAAAEAARCGIIRGRMCSRGRVPSGRATMRTRRPSDGPLSSASPPTTASGEASSATPTETDPRSTSAVSSFRTRSSSLIGLWMRRMPTTRGGSSRECGRDSTRKFPAYLFLWNTLLLLLYFITIH